MKKLLTLIIILSVAFTIQAQNITNTPGTNGNFIINSTTGGLLIPSMTQNQRDAISSPATGLLIFQTDGTSGFYYYNGTAWYILESNNNLTVSIDSLTDARKTGSTLFIGNAGVNLDTTGGSLDGDYNVFVGNTAGKEMVSGRENVGVGQDALTTGTGSILNVAIGSEALKVSTGSYNTALGASALYTNTTGTHNIAIGTYASVSSNTASNELNIGNAIYGTNIYPVGGTAAHIGINTQTPDASASLDISSTSTGLLIPRVDISDLSTADPVTSPATSLLVYNTNTTTGPGFFYWDGSAWVSATGAKKLDDLSDAKSDGFYSLYLGHSAGENATSATSRNVGVGPFALRSATGKWNVGVGRSAGTALTTGEENTFLGFVSGDKVNSGSNNTLVGSNCGYNFTSSSYNTFIGSHSGYDATGSSNILIGYNVEPSATSASNELNIGGAIYATGLYGTSAKVGIGNGNNAPAATLDVSGDVKVGTSINIGTAIHLTPGSAPASPTEGDMYMDSSTHKLMVYDGTTWQACW